MAERTEIRRRPKNRRAQIATVAAEAFSERGYHGVSVDEIASAVGISGPALYRHFPNKYALFLHAATDLATALEGAITDDADTPAATAAERLDGQILAAIRTTVANRRTAGLYRWESRYLDTGDRECIRATIESVNRRIGATLAELRPDLPQRDDVQICVALLSVIGSITVHRSNLPPKRLERLLLDACRTVSRVELPPPAEPTAASTRAPGIPLSNKREVLLNEAIVLFHARGYHEVSIEEIGSAAGINASGVYRHFAGKSDLLAAAFHRAADRLTVAVSTALGESTTPQEALRALVAVYVRLSFAQSELMSVYFAEIGSLPSAQRTELRNVQRLNIEEWARLLGETRTELSATECRFLVHAALSLVLDVGRVMHFDPTPGNELRVRTLMLATLFGEANVAPDHAGEDTGG
ncbi:TetR family transcriptional regulator [Rhodococcus sp. AG1013]|uniref:TetR/AcrR family transcriptional regulator n=1 Tax=Rhodococcus sp. AG1013 TaxID=2183996 RepID=UPI000E2B8CFB|nr:TetR/AcrR family transcriptional regulator [Rhodococcus sp. AG1013]RDI28162.1 TetR family transcriptional regulator [Rhodococcus sp. AG1013]